MWSDVDIHRPPRCGPFVFWLVAELAHPPPRTPPSCPMRLTSRRFVTSVLLLAAVACSRASEAPGGPPVPATREVPVTSARQLVERMRERYDGKWFRTLTFLQNNTLYKRGGGEDRTQWMEYMSVPGRLRIEYLPAANKSGVLFVNDTVYTFVNGKRMDARKRIHPLLLLGADVYAIPPERTLGQLDSLGIDLGKFREVEWEGRRTYVVGADAGDSTSSQFWVSADSLLVVRVVESQTAGSRTVATDYRFNKYADVGGFPIAVEILMLRDGRPLFKEEYADVKVDVDVPEALFNTSRWTAGPTP